MTTPLSRELALRIGLAANQMPELDTGALIGILSDAVGVPMTEEKFANLGMKTFRKAGGEALIKVPSAKVKTALKILKGEGVEAEEPALTLDAYEDGDMPGSIRVACASNRGEELDGHFGSCNRFVIYQLSADELRLIDERNADKPDDVEDKNKWRASLIGDCDIVYVASIGGPAAAKVVRANIHPVKHLTGGDARQVLGKLQQVLASSPPPWLARIMGQEAKSLAGFMHEENE